MVVRATACVDLACPPENVIQHLLQYLSPVFLALTCKACARCWSRTRVHGVQQRTESGEDSLITSPVAWFTERIYLEEKKQKHRPSPHSCVSQAKRKGQDHTENRLFYVMYDTKMTMDSIWRK